MLNGKIQNFHLWSNKVGDLEVVEKALKDLTKALGMTPHGPAVIREYPVDGKGGIGATACVAIQHLVESYIVYDSWVEHGYANIVINSCKPWDTEAALKIISHIFKPRTIRTSKPDLYLIKGGKNDLPYPEGA